jgi:hypothetical protein
VIFLKEEFARHAVQTKSINLKNSKISISPFKPKKDGRIRSVNKSMQPNLDYALLTPASSQSEPNFMTYPSSRQILPNEFKNLHSDPIFGPNRYSAFDPKNFLRGISTERRSIFNGKFVIPEGYILTTDKLSNEPMLTSNYRFNHILAKKLDKLQL